MRSQFIFILSITISLYVAANYYAGVYILRFFNNFSNAGYTQNFWLVWSLMAVLPFVGRFFRGHFSESQIAEGLTITGYYWLAFIYYLALTLLAVDLVFFVGKKFSLLSALNENYKFAKSTGILILAWVGLLLAYGTYNAQNPVVRHYDVTIPKNAGSMHSIQAVLVSDSHLGFIVDNKRLEKMIDMVNSLNPDIVFLAGDIIEEDANYFIRHKMGEQLQRLNPRLGTYAVLGNHEYIGSQVDEIINCLKDAGIFVLRDEYIKVNDSFYLVGRDDVSVSRFTEVDRLKLAEIIKGIDHSRPVILMDHQPFFLAEAKEQKVDLQLSGHTHHGQFFPNNLITGLIFENDWGYLKKNGFQSIVSAGFGTWGPPIRIGNYPEIVDINIRFNNLK